jgi:hypothetical protein
MDNFYHHLNKYYLVPEITVIKARVEALTAVTVKSTIFQDVTSSTDLLEKRDASTFGVTE